MTPAATTPAGRAASTKSTARTATPRPVRASGTGTAPRPSTATPGHRRGLTKPTTPRSPRRVSGPVRGRATGATLAPPRRAPKPRITPPKRRPRRASQSAQPLGARAVGFVRRLPDHVVLDRLLRGRAWIPVLGVMLAGIVAMQVEVLKLGASMGRSIETATALQSRNELLRDSVAKLADDQRIERLAYRQGMVMPGPAGVGFLRAGTERAVEKAIANIHAPDVAGFLALTTANGAVATDTTAATGTTAAGTTTVTPATSTVAPTAVTPTTVTPATVTPTTAAPTTAAPTTVAPTGAAATAAVVPTSTGTSSGG